MIELEIDETNWSFLTWEVEIDKTNWSFLTWEVETNGPISDNIYGIYADAEITKGIL
jgi:hypothetical protein